ncbi:hypothetical protein WNY59_04080 [Ahrensia kielensis]|uniref:Uncharacterized protein n=1 Tax=Ahrensia kielensis TaxID=76980 RepID=A0ABU9T4V3_9HYPH
MFSTAKCGHCGKTGTKVQEISPVGAAYKQMAVCCQSCSAILGVTGYYDSGTLLKQAERERAELSQKVQRLEQQLISISHRLQR